MSPEVRICSGRRGLAPPRPSPGILNWPARLALKHQRFAVWLLNRDGKPLGLTKLRRAMAAEADYRNGKTWISSWVSILEMAPNP